MMHLRNVSLVAVILVITSTSAVAQWINYPTPGIPRTPDGKPDLAAPAPRTADGKPDLTGIWGMPCSVSNIAVAGDLSDKPTMNCPVNSTGMTLPPEFVNIGQSLKDGLPYQPWAAELVKTTREKNRPNDPLTHCLPIGMVRLHMIGLLRKMVQATGLLVILNEENASYRQIFTDARPLPVDPNPSWNGYSSGKWEGDVLVVQTIGFRDGLWLDTFGSPLTDGARITERFRRVNYGTLEIELRIDDPKAYTKPWTIKVTQLLVPDTELLDFICNENEKDIQHLVPK